MGNYKLSDAVLKMYAPEVRLHPDETNRPSSVEFYLPRVRMTYSDDMNVMTTLTGTDPVPDDDIVEVTVNNITEFVYKGHYSNDEKTGKEFRLKMKGADGSSYQEETRAGQDYLKVGSGYEVHTDMVPCYVRVNTARSALGVYDISYYFFYPHNGATADLEYGAHQGDFEMIVVRIKERATAGTYDILGIDYVAHGGNHWYYPSEAGRPESVYSTTADGHPIVYCARKSHASYPTTGSRTTGGGFGTDLVAGGGPKWQTWKKLVRLVDESNEAPLVNWIRFPGRWGGFRKREILDENGPRTPSFTSQWRTDEFLTFWQIAGSLTQISAAADGSVWGVNDDNLIYRYNAATGKWDHVSGKLKWISVGKQDLVWGVNPDNLIYRYNAATGKWDHISGSLTQLEVTSSGVVWGVNKSDEVFRFDDDTGKWERMPGSLRRVSLSSSKNVWGVNAEDQIYNMKVDGSWDKVKGKLSDISAGSDSEIWGINAEHKIFRLTGVDEWTQMDGELKQLSALSQGNLWGVSADGRIFRRVG